MKQQAIMMRSLIVNFILIITKLVGGFLLSSVALIADGVHSFSDLMSDIFVILGIRHAIKPADDEHPFGHGKFEYILSLLLGISIITIAYNLGRNVIETFNDVPTIPHITSLLVVVFVIVAKFFLANYLIKKGKQTDSNIIQASGKESLTDVISSGVVLLGILLAIIGDFFQIEWLLKGDIVASIIIAIFIIRIGILIIWDAIKHIQGKAVRKEISDVYIKQIEAIDGVIQVDNLDMITYGPYYQALVDIQVDGAITVSEGHDIAKTVSKNLYQDEKINHVIVHVNPKEE